MTYPEYAEVKGVRYKLNTSYKIGIKCFKVINDPNIGDTERALAVIYLLFGIVPDDDYNDYLNICNRFLSCDKDSKGGKRDIDFSADEPYIMASFLSDYKINLADIDLHWWQFIELIGGLTEDSVLSRVREVRNYDLSEVKDEKQRRRIADAQIALALPVIRTNEEEQAIADFEAQFEV